MKFSSEQISLIKFDIELWVKIWKDHIVSDYSMGIHKLGFAKEQLKELICPTCPTPDFNDEEVDYICYMIGEWYIKWKNNYIDKQNKTHCLEKAAEDLINMLSNQGESNEDNKNIA